MGLSWSQVKALDDLIRKEVPVPQWNGSVFVRSLRADERSDLEHYFTSDKRTPGEFRRRLLAMTLVNDDGSKWIEEAEVGELMEKNGAAVETLFDAALAHNRISSGDAEELEKN